MEEKFREKNQKFVYTLRGCPLFWKFLKMPLFLSLMEIAENSNQTFWLKGKRRKNIPACQMKEQNLKQNKSLHKRAFRIRCAEIVAKC